MKYFILIVLWTLWCFIHSGMISLTVTDFLKKRLGIYFKFYRLFYILVSLITLFPVFLYSISIKGPVLFRWEGYFAMVQIALLIIAIILFISGALKYDLLKLLGVRQIKSGRSHAALSESGKINTSGIHSITRHPWYLGAIILLWIANGKLYVSNLIVNIILTLYLIIGTILEERKLIIKFGDKYRDYMSEVSMLFPTKWIISKITGKKNRKGD